MDGIGRRRGLAAAVLLVAAAAAPAHAEMRITSVFADRDNGVLLIDGAEFRRLPNKQEPFVEIGGQRLELLPDYTGTHIEAKLPALADGEYQVFVSRKCIGRRDCDFPDPHAVPPDERASYSLTLSTPAPPTTGGGVTDLAQLDGITCRVSDAAGHVATAVAADGSVQVKCVMDTNTLSLAFAGVMTPVHSCSPIGCFDFPRKAVVSPGDIVCPAAVFNVPTGGCQPGVRKDALATITPQPATGVTWSGCDTVTTTNECQVLMSANRAVTLTWTQ